MDVRVVEVRSPLDAATRSALHALEGRAADWRAAPNAPLTTSALAAGIVTPAGRLTGGGVAVALDPAQNNSFKFIRREMSDGCTVRFMDGRHLAWGVGSKAYQ